MISIVVIDDEIQDRERIEHLLRSQRDLDLQGFGKDGYDAIRLVRSLKPDIAILDISLDLYCGVEISHLLKRDSPDTAIVVMGAQADINLVKRAANGAAAACILKEADFFQLAGILRKVHKGGSYFNPLICTLAFSLLAKLLKEPSAGERMFSARKDSPVKSGFPAGLTRTEMRILAAMGDGCSEKEIADKLNLGARTVRNYISRIIRKIGLKNRPQAIAYAVKNGLSSLS